MKVATLRYVPPIFFMLLYFVILIGRDKRQLIRDKEAVRRHQTALGSAVCSVYVMLYMLLPVIFIVLYILKSPISIDLIEGVHLHDLL